MHVHWWIQQVTTRVGAVTCWIQKSVSPKQVVGFTCVFNSEVDQLTRKFIVHEGASPAGHYQSWCSDLLDPTACVTQASGWIQLSI